MEKLYLGDPNDAEVDALLSQLNDENLLKMKVNTHTSTGGFEYPTFTDGWGIPGDEGAAALDSQLTTRFSSLKLPIVTAKKKGKDSSEARKKVSDSKTAKKAKDYEVADKGKTSEVAKMAKDSEVTDGGNLEVDEKLNDSKLMDEEHSEKLTEDAAILRSSTSRNLSQRSEFLSFRSDDLEDLDADLNERFRALKGQTPPPPVSRNVGLDNLLQLASQDYEFYGSSLSTPSSPSANLLGRSKPRSSPRVSITSVSTSCNCSAPSPLKLLKQVSSKSFPPKLPAALPPKSPSSGSGSNYTSSSSGDRTPAKKSGKDYKVEGFGNSKPGAKEIAKKNKGRGNTEEISSTVKDMRRFLSSVADRVGFEKSRVSSSEEDESLGDDLHAWSVLEREQEFTQASSDEHNLNREAERVVEWAKDAARLGIDLSDSEAEDLEPGEDVESDEEALDERSKRGKSEKSQKIAKTKKKWSFF